MFRSSLAATLCAALLCSGAVAQQVAKPAWQGLGRAATAPELKAWDIDVRTDFKGLPAGEGSVAKGQDIWEAKCASCHGVFGESNEFFTPIIGGTTRRDRETGRVASLVTGSEAQRTTMMKVSTLSTLWDYINRAMPWNNPYRRDVGGKPLVQEGQASGAGGGVGQERCLVDIDQPVVL